MLRKKRSKSISKRLFLSVVILFLLQFFYVGLATAQDDIPLDSSVIVGVPGEPDFASFMQAPSDSTCEKCDSGCRVGTDHLKFDEIRELEIAVNPCIGPGTCYPGPHSIEICSDNPGFIGFSLDPDGEFTNSIVIEDVYISPETGSVNKYKYYIKGLDLTDLGPVTQVVNWPSGWFCWYNGLPCCCLDWTVIPYDFEIYMEEYNSTLYENPEWAGGGARIYPGKKSADDDVNRRTVKIKAYNAPCPNEIIYFAAIDIDDPSESPIIDPNGIGGKDNIHGSDQYIVDSEAVIADEYGYASWLFDVSMQPGDNFRFVATCDPDALGDRLVAWGPGPDVMDNYGASLPQDYAKITPSLTVWRQLHIEVDSMGIVQENHVDGRITKVGKAHKDYTVLTFEPKLSSRIDRNRFENGTIWISHPEIPYFYLKYQVKGNGLDTVKVLSTIVDPKVKGKTFMLFDDDDILEQVEFKDGDEGVDVPEPDTSIIQDSDDKELNRFAPAYIKPVDDLVNNNPTVPFVLNVPFGDTSVFRFDNKPPGIFDTDYWVAYLLGAYQGAVAKDVDPDKEKIDSAYGWNALGMGAVIFHETSAESFTHTGHVTAHELGHIFITDHVNEGGLMEGEYEEVYGDPGSFFSDKAIRLIRSRRDPK